MSRRGIGRRSPSWLLFVGEHILLGGDNMDLALAYALQAKLEASLSCVVAGGHDVCGS